MCLFKFANIYTIPERIKKGVWKNKKKAVCKCFIFSLPFPKAALVSAEIRKEYIEVVLALPMCFWAVAQCRWVWVEMPQRGQHSHFFEWPCQRPVDLFCAWIPICLQKEKLRNAISRAVHSTCVSKLCNALNLTKIPASTWLCRTPFSSHPDTTLF